MGTSKTASARALIDPEIKKEAETILKELGLSVSKSFELYYRQIIAHHGLPFELPAGYSIQKRCQAAQKAAQRF